MNAIAADLFWLEDKIPTPAGITSKIGHRCRETGAALVLDLTQSLGAMPFSVKEVQPDFLIASTYKWLLGPYSMGFLYADPKHTPGKTDRIQLDPTETQ